MDKKLDFLTKDLIDQAVVQIDKNGIPSNRNGTGYAVEIMNKHYPFKLIITEAAKLVNENLTSDDFSSNKKNRLGLEKLTNYKIVDITKKITFKNIEDLVGIINNELGDFCSKFQYTRKKLLNKGSATNRDKLFIVSDKDKDRDWVINPGGGTQIQYHLFLRNGKLCYGIGFNTQYVPFANKKSSIDYIQPYVHSFLAQPELMKSLKSEGFDFIIGDLEQLENLQNDNYVLIGKQFSIEKSEDFFKLPQVQFQEMIGELQGVLFNTYVGVMKQKKKFEKDSILKTMEKTRIKSFISLLEYKKQIILQGPPGTGKTYTAKDIAQQIITGKVSENKREQAKNLDKSEQFELIQFHPSYTYEDFVRGIVAESNDGKVAYRTINKSFGEFAEAALENYNLSRKDNTEANIKKWIDDKFEEFKNEIEVEIEENEIKLSGNVTIFEVSGNSFKYGKNWKISSNLNFQEIKKLIKVVVENKLVLSNQQIPKDLSVHAHYRYTYYNALLALFFDKYKYKEEATQTEEKKFVLVIDEINRANLPSVLGELIYSLEYRGQSVNSMYKLDNGETKITIPENLYIIGTMNTADRSVGHIDYAIRRRFAFKEVLPKELSNLGDKFKKEKFETVSKLFVKEIKTKSIELEASEHLSPEFADRPQDVWLGHSYFIEQEDENENPIDFKLRIDYEIIPILEEYIKDGILRNTEEVKNIIKGLN